MSHDRTPKQVVILVHGTFATADEMEGNKWWQRGSPFWISLSRHLDLHARLIEAGEMYRWSGDNSERARHVAAADLLADVALAARRKGNRLSHRRP